MKEDILTIEKIKCEICNHVLGFVDTDNLSVPINGSMFSSLHPGQWPDPFHQSLDWTWIRCPMCRKRPFHKDGEFITNDGRTIIAHSKEPNDKNMEDIIEPLKRKRGRPIVRR